VPSSELLRCKECGQLFDTVESLREHMKSERDEIENCVKGLRLIEHYEYGIFFTVEDNVMMFVLLLSPNFPLMIEAYSEIL
jgi:hypothetical protein